MGNRKDEKDALDEALRDGAVAVCVKDDMGRVLMQDDACKAICGDRTGMICTDGCMALFADDDDRRWSDWGSSSYRNSTIHGTLADVTMISSPQRITTFLQPLDERYRDALARCAGAGLTSREEEVLALILRGISNNGIAGHLEISHATLRTHLNRLYAKLQQHDIPTDFLPACRTRQRGGGRQPALKEAAAAKRKAGSVHARRD